MGFENLWDDTVCMVGLPTVSKKRKRNNLEEELSPEQQYRKWYNAVIDNLLGHITQRFSSIQKLKSFELLNPKSFKNYSQSSKFLDSLINDLIKTYPNLFDTVGLKTDFWFFTKQ